MKRKSTTYELFALRLSIEKYREGQKVLHCVFVDLEKAFDRVQRAELWYCIRKSRVAETYVIVVQNMYESLETVVRCVLSVTRGVQGGGGPHQGSALSPFLFAMVMDRLTNEVLDRNLHGL